MKLEVTKKIAKRMENLIKGLSEIGEGEVTTEILKQCLGVALVSIELLKKGMLEALEELEEND